MKKLFAVAAFIACSASVFAQQDKKAKKEARKERIEGLIRQEEEGVLVYNKQTIFGIQLRSNGYGAFLELGKMKNRDITNVFQIELTETKNQREQKDQLGPQAVGVFLVSSNPFIYGKQNYFYNLRFGMGQTRRIGDKGNKNGVSVQGLYLGGISLGLLRPYYLEIVENPGEETRKIKYGSGVSADSAFFLNPNSIVGGTGIGKGWGEIKIKPGIYGKTGLRFDWGRFNEVVSALEVGVSAEYYPQKIPIMINTKNPQFFFNAYVAIEFGKRK